MNNPITIDVNLGQCGCLSDSIADDKKHLVQSLTICGYYSCGLNDDFIKSMCNTVDKNGNRTGGRLNVLDFSKAQISERDRSGFKRCYDAFKPDSFKDCITLREIVLGELGDFHPSCLSGCISLKSIEYKGYRKYTSCKGVLYENGDYDSNADYHSYNPGRWILIKFPPAKMETKEIEFESINKIADYAFEDFVGTDLYLTSVPPICSERAFYNVDISKINIHIPKESYNSYWMHPIWGQFNLIPE